MSRTRKRALFVDTETTYGSDPSANGSGYAAVPCFSIGDLTDGKEQLETAYHTGTVYDTAPETGKDGGSFDFETPVIGLETAAGDGTDASTVTDDWEDALLLHTYGNQTTTSGEGLLSVASATAVTLDADAYNVQNLFPVYEAGVPAAGARSQWNLVTVDPADNSYTIAPGFAENPTGAGVAYGSKIYRPDDDGGDPLSFAYQDDELIYRCSGARVTSHSITWAAGQMLRSRWSVRFDNKTEEASTKTSLPTALAAPAITPLKGLLSPVWFNGTLYATSRVEINFNLETSEEMSTAATNGRAGDELIKAQPTIVIEPLRTDAILNLKRNVTKGRLLIQLGGGVLSGGVLNTMCFHAEEAYVSDVSPADENGRTRQQVTLTVSEKKEFSAGVSSLIWQLARA